MAHSNSSRGSSAQPFIPAASGPTTAPRELAPYSRVRGGTRYTQVASTRRRRKHLVLGVVGSVLAMVAIGAAIAVICALNFYGSIGSRLNDNVSDATKAVLADQQATAKELVSNWTDMSPFYMLLLGVDSDESRMYGDESSAYGADDSLYRTDTIILARVDPGNKKVTLVSIHRDTWLEIDGRERKINEAYSLGGVPKTIEVISEFAGVPITHYAQINIDGLFAIVDALGGVEVDVPYDINDWWTGWTLEAGYQTLNGEDAMIFTRSRHAYDDLGDGDRYRAAHQRLFLSALLSKLMAASPMDMVATIDTLANYVETDLSVDQIVNLALAMRGIDAENDVYSTMNPTEATYEDYGNGNGAWYEIPQMNYWHELMRQVDSGERPDSDTAYRSVTDDINNPDHVDTTTPAEPTSTTAAPATTSSVAPVSDAYVVIKSAPENTSAGAAAADTLRANGWTVEDAGAGNASVSTTTVVYDDPSYAADAQAIATLLGGRATEAGDVWSMAGDIMVVTAA